MTVESAKSYLTNYFSFNKSAFSRSSSTNNGFFTFEDVKNFSDETIVSVANDLNYQDKSRFFN